MLGSTTLDTALGLVFVFLLVSLACTAATEFIELLLRRRATHLEEGLRRMLGAPAPGESGEVPAIPESTRAGIGAAPATRSVVPAPANYTPPAKRQLSAAESEVVAAARAAAWRVQTAQAEAVATRAAGGADAALAGVADDAAFVAAAQAAVGKDWLQKLYAHPLVRSLSKGDSNDPSYIKSGTFARALMHLVRTEAADVAAGANPVETFRNAVGQIPNEAVKNALLAMVDSAGDSLEKVQKEIEGWFDGAMDRVSGWYKRWSQVWVLAIGAVLTVLMNVDAVAIGRALWRDPALRDAIAAAAQKQIEAGLPEKPTAEAPAPPADAAKEKGKGTVTATTTTATPKAQGTVTGTTTATGKAKADDSNADVRAAWKNLKEAEARIAQTGLPVGWDCDDDRSVPRFWTVQKDEAGKESKAFNWQGWPMKFLGLLVTILAVSLGAPFWFDLLNKIMVVRNTVKPQEKSKDEKSKD